MYQSTILIEPHYMPSIAFFSKALSFDTILLEQNAYYQKQTYRNRCYVLGANKVEMLTVPVVDGNKKILLKDIKIDNASRWQQIHWRTITAAYQKAPYFEFFADYFQPFYNKKYDTLLEYNMDILTTCLKMMRTSKTICLTENYENKPETHIFDARGVISPKDTLQLNDFFKPIAYYQNFGNEFVPNLSILDLFFCKGTESLSIIQKSVYI